MRRSGSYTIVTIFLRFRKFKWFPRIISQHGLDLDLKPSLLFPVWFFFQWALRPGVHIEISGRVEGTHTFWASPTCRTSYAEWAGIAFLPGKEIPRGPET